MVCEVWQSSQVGAPIRAADGVRGVAVLAGRQLTAGLDLAGDPGPVDAVPELFLDPVVTSTTGVGDVVVMY